MLSQIPGFRARIGMLVPFSYHCRHHVAVMAILVESVSKAISFGVLAHEMVTGLGQNTLAR